MKSCLGDNAAALLTCGSQQRHMQPHLKLGCNTWRPGLHTGNAGPMHSSREQHSHLPQQCWTDAPPAQCLCSTISFALQATQELLQVASTFKNLQAFVHVSTAFVNGNLPKGSRVLEHVYPLDRQAGSQVKPVEAPKLPGPSPDELAASLACLPEKTAQNQVRTAMLMPAACSSC